MSLVIAAMTTEENLVLKNQYVECVTEILRQGRGGIFKIMVEEAHFPQASLLVLQQVTEKYHSEYAGDNRLENTCVELI